MDATSALITFAVGVGGVVLGAMLSRHNERRGTHDRLLAEALNDMVASIAEVAGGAGSEAQWRYGSAVSRIALHAPSDVIEPLRAFQDDANTGTTRGRERLITVVNAARAELGHAPVASADLAVLLFGAHRGPFELAWAEQRELVDVGLQAARSTGAASLGTQPELAPARAAAPQDPRTAIQLANGAIDDELRRAAARAGLSASDEETLLAAGVITAETANAVQGLRALANLAAHGPAAEPSPERAEEFLAMVSGLLWAIGANARSFAKTNPDAARPDPGTRR